jgi:predicted naringenin-chalcone synthase
MDLSMAYDRSKVLPALYRRAGVQKRHSVLLEEVPPGDLPRQSFYQKAFDDQDRGPTTRERMARYASEAPRLATEACSKALQRANLAVREVTHLVTVSCSGFSAPGFDVSLFDSLELPRSASRTHLGFMGCHGAMNGLRVASAYATDPQARVLVCAVEVCSLHHQYTSEPQQLVANTLFSDGAAAVVVGQSLESSSWQLVANGSLVIPGTLDMMSWNIGNHGFQMTLSPLVPEVILRTLRPWLSDWLSTQGTSLSEVEGWGIHPGGPRILRACTDALGLLQSATQHSTDVLADCGNMSSPTVLFILDRLQAHGIRNCVLLAFGPGLTIEAALLRATLFGRPPDYQHAK